jgi:hypothetical protein
LNAVLFVEENRPTLDTVPLNRLESLMVDTRGACLITKEERACRANRVASGVYAGRPGHDPALAGGTALETPVVVVTLDDVMKRAKAVREMADEAVRLDGTPEASLVKRLFQACRRNLGQRFCSDFATFARESDINLIDHPDLMPNLGFRQGGHPSKVGQLAGFAAWIVADFGTPQYALDHRFPTPGDPKAVALAAQELVLAETTVASALEEARKVADARAEHEKKIAVETQAISAATTECTLPACKARCDSEAAYCVAWANRLRDSKPPKLADAKGFYQRGCDGGLETGCTLAAQADQQIRQEEARVNYLWGQVTQVGDDLVQRKFVIEKVVRIATPRTRTNIPAMLTVNTAIVTEKYCPARKEFVQATSTAEFQKRATAHCKDETPRGQGLSGADVLLSTQCQAVYSTGCP